MRTDLFTERKCVHVKLDKDVHSALRSKLFHQNLSMQEVFDEFARLIAAGDARAEKIVEQLVMRKIKDQLEGKTSKKKKLKNISELDHDALYDLIEKDPHDDEAA